MIRQDLARSLAGTCLLLTTLTFIALALIRRWITDVSDQRRALAETQGRAEAERSRYLTLEAALEGEHARLSTELAGERANLAAQLEAERQALDALFEERRATLINETTEAVVLMFQGGKLAPKTTSTSGKLLRFPQQQPEEQAEHVRSREQTGFRP